MSRFRDAEKLAENIRAEIPEVAIQWLAAVREKMEKLTKAALSADVSDSEFRALVDETAKDMPELLKEMDHDALAKLMEGGMGAAMANGIAERIRTAPKG